MIRGNRVYLRAFDVTDIPTRVEWMNNPEVRKMLNAPFPVSELSTRRWLERVVADPSQEDYIVCLNESGKAIGYTGFRGIDFVNQKAECYIGIGEMEYWGQGYGKEVRILALAHIFSKYNLNMVFSKIRSDNVASIRMNLSVGFHKDGTVRHDIFSHGAFRDTVIMTILRREFVKKYSDIQLMESLA